MYQPFLNCICLARIYKLMSCGAIIPNLLLNLLVGLSCCVKDSFFSVRKSYQFFFQKNQQQKFVQFNRVQSSPIIWTFLPNFRFVAFISDKKISTKVLKITCSNLLCLDSFYRNNKIFGLENKSALI